MCWPGLNSLHLNSQLFFLDFYSLRLLALLGYPLADDI